MKRILPRMVVLACVTSILQAEGLPPPADLKIELKQYYEREAYPGSWTTAIRDLSATDESKRAAASEKLVAVLSQAMADERAGVAPWRQTPFWGSSGENPARNLRLRLLRELAREPARPGAVPVLRWYLFQEPLLGPQTAAMQALEPIATIEANALRMEVIKARPENAWVLAAALRQAWKQKLAVADETLMELAKHHRPSIRTVAAEWLKAEKKPVPNFDAARALQSAGAKNIVEQLTALWPDIPAANVVPLWCRETYLRADGQTVDGEPEFVWPMTESTTALKAINLDGRFRIYQQSARNGKPKKAGESTWRTEPADLEREVMAIIAIRAKGNPDFALSSQGGLTGQFEGNGPSLKELLLGIWLHKANRRDLAAALLLPAFDAVGSDTAVVDIARRQLAVVYGQEMLDAFTYSRNYPEALRLANLTGKLYPHTIYSEHAKRLARELPLRKDDFKTFTLPTPAEWAALQPTLSREQKIHYLCGRLRLLNCFQMSQPGGVEYYDPQFKEPGLHGRGDDRATEVINPLSELAGDPGDEWRKRPKSDGLKLTLADVPTLATHLKDDWTMVMVSFWREFHPSRELHYTRDVIAGLVRGLAKQDICRVEDMAKMSPQEIEKRILAIQAWAREHAGKSAADLHLEALQKAVREDQRWSWNADHNAAALADLNDRRVIACALEFLKRKKINDYDFERILYVVAPLDPATFKPYALKMLAFQDQRDQLWAACLLIAADESPYAFDKLETILSAGETFGEAWNWRHALEVLGAAKSDRAKRLIGRIISGRRLLVQPGEATSWELRRDFVPKLFKGGYRDEILKFYDALLDDREPWVNSFGDKDLRNNDVYAAEMIEFLKGSDEALRVLSDKPGKLREKIPDLKRWIAARLAEAKK